MTKVKTLFLFFCLVCTMWVSAGLTQDFLSRGKYMTAGEVKARWGEMPFSSEKFKAGSRKERAAMAYDLTKRKILIGKTAKEVKSLLGDTSGFFWSERIPTYLIEEGWKEKKDSWQLVFLIDENERVTEVRIHKNCCEKSN